MRRVIIKNELKLELYRDFIKSGVVPNGPAPSRFASHLKYYVENVYAHLIAEGIIIDADDVEYYPDGKTVKSITEASKVTHYHVNGDVDYVTLNGNTTYYRNDGTVCYTESDGNVSKYDNKDSDDDFVLTDVNGNKIDDLKEVRRYSNGAIKSVEDSNGITTYYHKDGTFWYAEDSNGQELNNAEVELEKSKERFLRGHAERMAELNLALNNIKEDLENSDTIEEVFDDVQKAKEIEEELEGISKDLDALLD